MKQKMKKILKNKSTTNPTNNSMIMRLKEIKDRSERT